MAQLVESFYHQNPDELGESIADFTWKGVKYPLYCGNNIVGRKGRNARIDVKLDHVSISDVHAEIEQIDEDFFIRDLRSDQGTSVEVIKSNGAKAFEPLTRQSVKLFHGAKIHIGSLECYFNYTNERARKPTVGVSSSSIHFSSPNSSDTEITTEVPTQIVDEALIHNSLVEEHCSDLPPNADPEDTIDNNVISPKKYNKNANKLICHSQNSEVVPMRLASVASSVCDENTQFFTGDIVEEDDVTADNNDDKSEAMDVNADTQFFPTPAVEDKEEYTAVEVDELLKSAPDNDEDDNEPPPPMEGAATALPQDSDVDSDATDMEGNAVAEEHPIAEVKPEDPTLQMEVEAAVVPSEAEVSEGYESEESADLINVTAGSQSNKISAGDEVKGPDEVILAVTAKTMSNVTGITGGQSFSPPAGAFDGGDTFIDPPEKPSSSSSSPRAAPIPHVEEATYLTETYIPAESHTYMEPSTGSTTTVAQTIAPALSSVSEARDEEIEANDEEIITAPEPLNELLAEVAKRMESAAAPALPSDPSDKLEEGGSKKRISRSNSATSSTSEKAVVGQPAAADDSGSGADGISRRIRQGRGAANKKGNQTSTSNILEAIAEEMVKKEETETALEIAVESENLEGTAVPAASKAPPKRGRSTRESAKEQVEPEEVKSVASEEVKLPAKRGRKGAVSADKEPEPLIAVPAPRAAAAASSRSKKRAAPENDDESTELPQEEKVFSSPVKRTKTSSSAAVDPVPASSSSSSSRAVTASPGGNSAAVAAPSVVRILFTGMDKEKEHLAMVKSLRNAEITEDPTMATHLIPGTDLKRTAKFMIALNSGVKYVVTLDWLIDSAKSRSKVAIDLTDKENRKKYQYVNKEKEELWNFSLYHTLSLPRGEGYVGVYSGYAYFVWPGVCGNGAPGAEDMKSLIISGGGMWLDSLDIYHNTTERAAAQDTIISTKGKAKVAVPPLPGSEILPLIVIITEAVFNTACAAGAGGKRSKGSGGGAAVPEEHIQILSFLTDKTSKTEVSLFTCEFLFLGALRQQLNFKQNGRDIHKLLPGSPAADSSSKSSRRK